LKELSSVNKACPLQEEAESSSQSDNPDEEEQEEEPEGEAEAEANEEEVDKIEQLSCPLFATLMYLKGSQLELICMVPHAARHKTLSKHLHGCTQQS